MAKTPEMHVARHERLAAEWREWRAEMEAEGNRANVLYAEGWIDRHETKAEEWRRRIPA